MNYRTTCPQCASVFRLGADQLDAAQGWVQCSVCGAAFDARPSLLMEDGSPLPAVVEPAPPESPPSPEPAPPAGQEAIEVASAETPEATPGEETPEAMATDVTPRGIAQREASFDLDSIILIDPDLPPMSDDYGPLPEIPATPSAGQSTLPPVYPAAFAPKPAAAAAPIARVEYAQAQYSRAQPGSARIPSAPRRSMPWAWGAASALLVVVLLAQAAYYLRDTLVSRLPQTRPAFEQACAVLGCTLSLPKNLALLQIVGSDLQTEASGRLKLSLTLGNRADHAQAWPVLVLTLTDQRNRPLARRSFAPSEYLGDARRIAAGIPPRSEQALSLPLTVHELTPMGFDLQLAY